MMRARRGPGALLLTAAAALAPAGAGAQSPDQLLAQRLMETGRPAAALRLLETLPMTHPVLEHRARAHLMLADRSLGPERCAHARAAYDFASLASSSSVVGAANRILEDDRCPLDPGRAR